MVVVVVVVVEVVVSTVVVGDVTVTFVAHDAMLFAAS